LTGNVLYESFYSSGGDIFQKLLGKIKILSICQKDAAEAECYVH
jgi:hypothetical protein